MSLVVYDFSKVKSEGHLYSSTLFLTFMAIFLKRFCVAQTTVLTVVQCVSTCVWRMTHDISCALEKVTLVERSLHLGLPCPWILWVFVLEPMAEWDDIYYICLTADQLVLTHPPHMLQCFVVSFLVKFK